MQQIVVWNAHRQSAGLEPLRTSAVRREGGQSLLGQFRNLGEHELRGREGVLQLWGRQAELRPSPSQ